MDKYQLATTIAKTKYDIALKEVEIAKLKQGVEDTMKSIKSSKALEFDTTGLEYSLEKFECMLQIKKLELRILHVELKKAERLNGELAC